jgi:hypothetical protein
MRILILVIPAHPHPAPPRAAHQGNAFRDHVKVRRVGPGDPNLGFQTELYFDSLFFHLTHYGSGAAKCYRKSPSPADFFATEWFPACSFWLRPFFWKISNFAVDPVEPTGTPALQNFP